MKKIIATIILTFSMTTGFADVVNYGTVQIHNLTNKCYCVINYNTDIYPHCYLIQAQADDASRSIGAYADPTGNSLILAQPGQTVTAPIIPSPGVTPAQPAVAIRQPGPKPFQQGGLVFIPRQIDTDYYVVTLYSTRSTTAPYAYQSDITFLTRGDELEACNMM